MDIFSQIELKFTIFNIINFILGKNINQEGGGGWQKTNFEFNIHPCNRTLYTFCVKKRLLDWQTVFLCAYIGRQ